MYINMAIFWLARCTELASPKMPTAGGHAGCRLGQSRAAARSMACTTWPKASACVQCRSSRDCRCCAASASCRQAARPCAIAAGDGYLQNDADVHGYSLSARGCWYETGELFKYLDKAWNSD